MPSITTSITDTHITRANVYSELVKQALLEKEFPARNYVNWVPDYNGTTLNIPSVGEFVVQTITEDVDITTQTIDTGNFTFTIDKYIGLAAAITDKARQDSYKGEWLESQMVTKQQRALSIDIETRIWAITQNAGIGAGRGGQTTAALNTINGANHRFVGSGTNNVMGVKDFTLAKYALDKAQVPDAGRVAFVDPSVEYAMNNLTNLTNITNNKEFEGIVNTGFLTTGMRFIKNFYGFGVYVSNYLPDANGTGSETINGVAATNAKCNIFFAAGQEDINPFIGVWRQMPKFESERQMQKTRDYFQCTARYGVSIFRPENLVTVVTDTTQVS